MPCHIITMRNGRSVNQQTPQWPHNQFSWTHQQRRWKQWSQWDTRRWSPGDRRKRRRTSLQQWSNRLDNSPHMNSKTGSFIVVFSSGNECLQFTMWDHTPQVNLIKHSLLSGEQRMSRTSVGWQSHILEVSIWHHCFCCEVWGQLSNMCLACSHFQSDPNMEGRNS